MEKKILRVRIDTKDEKAFTKLVLEEHLDMAGERREKDGKMVGEAYVISTQLEKLRRSGIGVTVLDEDANRTGMQRQKQVSSVNRFALGERSPTPPRGFGKKE
jgi:hypothetical protein